MGEDGLFITLMRHGRSRADDEQVHVGHYDSPLTNAERDHALLNGQGIRFEYGDTGYFETVYAPGKHHWVMRVIMLTGIGEEG